jgi:hypothetical protein
MNYGYFDDPSQQEPAYDPGLKINCPICETPLNYPANKVKTICLMPYQAGSTRSYFYRTHKDCFDALSPEEQTNLDSQIIDVVAPFYNTDPPLL